MRIKMGVVMNDFFIVDRLGLSTVDVPRLEKLSREEFKEIYLGEMEQFIKYHRRNPRCSRCPSKVERPEDLVRYFGENLHFQCFREGYSEERSRLKEREKRYFDLIFQMRR